MITIDTTKNEIIDFINQNCKQVMSQEHKANAEWSKIVRDAKGQKTSMLYEYEIEGVRLYHFRSGQRKQFHYNHILEIPFAKDKFQYVVYDNNMLYIWKFTHHFFERYKERLNLKCSNKSLIKHYMNHSNLTICIYRKHNHIVFATEKGLILGIDDDRLGMNIGCTFVDYNLLKVSQRAAFNKVQQISEEVIKKYIKMNKSGISHYLCISILEGKYREVYKAAEEIYAMYYEMGDLRERK